MSDHIQFILIAAVVVFLLIELLGHRHRKKRIESFTNEIRSFKNRNKRKIRHAVRDGFTQMKSLIG